MVSWNWIEVEVRQRIAQWDRRSHPFGFPGEVILEPAYLDLLNFIARNSQTT